MGASACRCGRGRAVPQTDRDRLAMRTDTDAADERVERAALYVHDALQGRCRGIDWAMAAPSRVRAQQVRDPTIRRSTATTRQATTTTARGHEHHHHNRCSAASGSSARRIWSCTCRSDSSSGRSGDVIITPSSRRRQDLPSATDRCYDSQCDTPGDDIPRFGLPVLPLWASLALEGVCVSVFFAEMALKVMRPW